MNITIQQLRAFIAVDRFRSFTKAATSLHLSQPALTIQIRHLEEALGQKLFDRTTRVVRLTDAGKQALITAATALEQLDVLASWPTGSLGKGGWTIRMACLPSIAAKILPEAIATFRATHEDVNFVLKDVVGRHIVDSIRQEAVEFGITDADVDSSDLRSSLLFEETMHVFYGAGHPLDTAQKITVAELAAYPIILMSKESNARAILSRAFADSGSVPRTVCEVIYMSTAIAMVRAGLGITVLPPTAVEPSAMADLKSRSVDDRRFNRRIAVMSKIGRSLYPVTRDFLGHLRKVTESLRQV